MLKERVLNRTLLARQHLLERTEMPALDMIEHLVGLQAQNPLPPYLSLWSRIRDFDPAELSGLLAARKAVRLLLMRGTIHLVSAADALTLRPLMQPMLDKITRNSQGSREAAGVPRDDLATATRKAFTAGPLTLTVLGEQLARAFPGYPASHLANAAREMLPLVQIPPRGLWKRSGGVVYATAETWLGAEQSPTQDPAELVRRYLRAFGPGTAADVTAWSGITGVRDVLRGMPDLVTYCRADGRPLHDLEGLELAAADQPAPVRLLGEYDNLWLAHADRDRVTSPEARARWMGANGGIGKTVFIDGHLAGLWRVTDGRVDVELFRRLTRSEREELDAEVAGVEGFLAR